MKLSIVNYGTGVNTDIPKYAKKEDEDLIKTASEIVRERSFGRGAILVSQVMHTDLVNLNNRAYMCKGMDDSVTSFFHPHFTPFLMHHENGGRGVFGGGDSSLLAVGSNIFARYLHRKVETATGTASGYVKVATFIGTATMVGSTRAIDALQSRQLLTLSIGARVSDDNYKCSICGNSLYSDECDHSIGQTYDGKKCYAQVYNPFFREYSAVYSPADINAIIRRVDIDDSYGSNVEDHLVDQSSGIGNIAIYETTGNTYTSADISDNAGDDTEEGDESMTKPNKTDESTSNDGTVSQSISELAKLVLKYEKKVRELSDLIEAQNQMTQGLRDVISEKDELISVLTKHISDKSEDTDFDPSQVEEPNDSSTEEPGNEQDDSDATDEGTNTSNEGTNGSADGDSDDNTMEDSNGSNESDNQNEDDVADSEEENSDGNPNTGDVEASDDSTDSESSDSQTPADGSVDDKSYGQLIHDRNKFSILSVSSSIGRKKGRNKLPKRFNI